MTQGEEVKSIYADELRQFIREKRESDYQLVDVREPREYREGHIPGAKLVPLGEIPLRISELPPEVDLLFYCRSGKRSRMAASLVAESGIEAKNIYTVEGGILAWDGKAIEDFPRVKVFSGVKDIVEILMIAMDLEKGAWNFYSAILEKYPESKMAPAAKSLVKLEENHARTIFGILERQTTEKPITGSFKEFFNKMDGSIIEGGETIEEALEKIKNIDPDDCLSFGELALDIEYRAYDVYKNLFYQSSNEDEKKVYHDLSQQEKGHALVVAKHISKCME